MNNQEANMKTILEIAKECDAQHCQTAFSPKKFIVFENEAQLTAIIEAWNRQNSEPIYEEFNPIFDAYYACDKDTYDSAIKKRIVYLAPPQPQTVKDMLEMAAKIPREHAIILQDGIFGSQYPDEALAILRSTDAMSTKIRALIDQPAEKG